MSFLLSLLFLPLNIVGLFFPKRNDIWIFGSWSGKTFSDNSQELYLYVKKHAPHIKAIWLTRQNEIVSNLRKEGMKAEYFYSFKGIYYSLVGRVAIMSCSWIDLPISTFLFSQKTLLVQLWHGTPLKKMHLKNGSVLKKLLRSFFLAYTKREYDILVSASELNVSLYKDIFNLEDEKIKVLGQPRNDRMDQKKSYSIETDSFSKRILYMPTWRTYDVDLFGFGFDLDAMQTFLEERNAVLVIKIHPHEVEKYRKRIISSNVVFWGNQDLYSCLSNFDLLLTDYSSIYFDYLLLDKPIVFTSFDQERYQSQNGFCYEYEEVTPGPKVKDWGETITAMKRVFEGHDDYYQARQEVNALFNKFIDFKSSERVYHQIIDSIKESGSFR